MSSQGTAPAWFAPLSTARPSGDMPLPDATAIEIDSRLIEPGAVFVAVPGAAFDGHDYIGAAIERGAAAVIAQEDRRAKWEPFVGRIPLVAVPNTRIALAEAAAGFYGHPARSLGMVGVTGTDGKTTTTHLIAHVLTACGLPAGYLSSVAFGMPDGTAELNATHMTTVEAPAVQRHLARIRDAGGRYAVVEASSIGLDVHRVDQCEFDVGVFTNLTPDHLDYHLTMERYRDAKAELFRMVDRSVVKPGIAKAAVLKVDDAATPYLREQTRSRAYLYGLGLIGDIRVEDFGFETRGIAFEVSLGNGAYGGAFIPLLGEFNLLNGLAAIGVAVSQGVGVHEAAAALLEFPGVPGRMELIDEGQPFRVVVDIASTEQAMRNVLKVLRENTAGRLIVVFGAAGERDRERRSGVARAVAERADHAIITNEDPRSEDPEAIIEEIAAALLRCSYGAEKANRIPDRRSAIARAFQLARRDDTVLLAGKGTEQSIVIGTTHHPWDERTVARELLTAGAKPKATT